MLSVFFTAMLAQNGKSMKTVRIRLKKLRSGMESFHAGPQQVCV